jgi:hypothetical protein
MVWCGISRNLSRSSEVPVLSCRLGFTKFAAFMTITLILDVLSWYRNETNNWPFLWTATGLDPLLWKTTLSYVETSMVVLYRTRCWTKHGCCFENGSVSNHEPLTFLCTGLQKYTGSDGLKFTSENFITTSPTKWLWPNLSCECNERLMLSSCTSELVISLDVNTLLNTEFFRKCIDVLPSCSRVSPFASSRET